MCSQKSNKLRRPDIELIGKKRTAISRCNEVNKKIRLSEVLKLKMFDGEYFDCIFSSETKMPRDVVEIEKYR